MAVALTARRAEELERAVESMREAGGVAHAIDADVQDPDSLKSAAGRIQAKLGRCDMVVPAAGAELLMPLDGMSAKRWRSMLDVHVTGAMETVRVALPLLRKAGGNEGSQGRVTFLSSAAAIKGWPGQSAYAAAKGAQISAMRSLAAELAPAGIRVNAVAAGMVRTPMQERLFARMPPNKREEIECAHPLGMGEPSNVSDAVLFLLSHQAEWITGACLAVDGGLSIG